VGQSFHLNPYERSTLQSLVEAMSHPGTSGLAQVGESLISGATDRRTTNLQTRESGLQALQQQAMQLAAQGASPDAVQAAVLGQANDLPLMNGDKGSGMLGDLAGYVGGLYNGATVGEQGPISGLAPADYRAQFQTATTGLSDQNKADLGTVVIKNLQAGVPFVDIREAARQYAITQGGTESDVAEAVSTAEQMYQQLTGMNLADMRSLGDELRTAQSQNPNVLGQMFTDNPGLGAPPFQGVPADQVDVTSFLGAMASRPGALNQLSSMAPNYDLNHILGFG
jgi:hypothetical protein